MRCCVSRADDRMDSAAHRLSVGVQSERTCFSRSHWVLHPNSDPDFRCRRWRADLDKKQLITGLSSYMQSDRDLLQRPPQLQQQERPELRPSTTSVVKGKTMNVNIAGTDGTPYASSGTRQQRPLLLLITFLADFNEADVALASWSHSNTWRFIVGRRMRATRSLGFTMLMMKG